MTIAVIVLVVLIGILGFASTKPSILNIQRVADIKAPPERIFELINDFHNWPAWEPQDTMDSTMKRSFGETASGKGATSEWTSKGRAGSGRAEITESTAPFKITVTVDFVKPFESHTVNEFTLEPTEGTTRVTWAWRGTIPYVAKVMSTLVNMEHMLGKHFETGLRSLKTLSEHQSLRKFKRTIS